MNIKLLVKELEMSEEEFKQHLDLVTKLRALSETERELLMTALGPQKPAAKKSSKKAGKKSARASGMEAQLVNRRQEQQKINKGACTYILESGLVCNTGDNNPIHDETFGYAGYHPFQPAASSAPLPSDQASSEIGKGAAGDVHRAAGSGD